MRSLRAVPVVLVLAACAFAQEAYKGPLEHAKVGEWVSYQVAQDMRMKQSVVKVDGRKVTLKSEMWIKGTALPSMETPIDLDKKSDVAERAGKADAAGKTEETTLTIEGHVLKCHLLTQGNLQTWTCDDVPITGIVKQEMDGRPSLDLTGYGSSPDEDKLKK